jgi:hypothetical protein
MGTHKKPSSCLPRRAVGAERLLRSNALHGVYGAESKDPGNASWQTRFQAFRPRTTGPIKKVTSSWRLLVRRLLVRRDRYFVERPAPGIAYLLQQFWKIRIASPYLPVHLSLCVRQSILATLDLVAAIFNLDHRIDQFPADRYGRALGGRAPADRTA